MGMGTGPMAPVQQAPVADVDPFKELAEGGSNGGTGGDPGKEPVRPPRLLSKRDVSQGCLEGNFASPVRELQKAFSGRGEEFDRWIRKCFFSSFVQIPFL